jgi:hypothetical protein
MTTSLSQDKLYRVSFKEGIQYSRIRGATLPTITFKYTSGTCNIYGLNTQPASLSDMVTESSDDITADTVYKIQGIVNYMAFNGGVFASISHSDDLKFEDLGSIS